MHAVVTPVRRSSEHLLLAIVISSVVLLIERLGRVPRGTSSASGPGWDEREDFWGSLFGADGCRW